MYTPTSVTCTNSLPCVHWLSFTVSKKIGGFCKYACGLQNAEIDRIYFFENVNDNQCTQGIEFVHVTRLHYTGIFLGVQWSGCLTEEVDIG